MSQALRRKLKSAREKLDMSQGQFAAMLGMPVRTLQKWEIDASTPRGLALKMLEAKLDEILRK